MLNLSAKSIRRIFMTGVAAAALLALPVAGSAVFNGKIGFDGKAYAQGQGQGGGGGQGQGQGGKGGGGAGAGGGHSTGSGQGGPSADSDAKGPKYGGGENANKPGSGTQGGKPVWAQEGIPEVELGRLSVVRAPAHVIDKAEAEAIANFNPTASAALYSMTAEAFAAYVLANYATVVRIDSPLENLGLYKEYLADLQTALPGVTPASKLDLAAIFLGSASDKTIAVSNDTVIAVTKILGLPAFTEAEIAALAAKADTVRLAIAEAHG